MIKLLVVDQHPIVSKGLELIFGNSREIRFSGAVTDGESVFDFIKKNAIDVILMEIDLPKLNGITALRRLKKEFANTKVIIFSAQPEEVYAVSAIKAGASGYINKSTDIITIKEAIVKVHEGGTFLSNELSKNLAFGKKSSNSFYKKLSTREVEVLKLLSSGKRNKEIAKELGINEKTVSTYRSRLMKKLNVTNLVDLVNTSSRMSLFTLLLLSKVSC